VYGSYVIHTLQQANYLAKSYLKNIMLLKLLAIIFLNQIHRAAAIAFIIVVENPF
jgi:hypothetical protein